MNPMLARMLVALSYPVRLTAHLTEPGARRGGARLMLLSTGDAGAESD